MACPNLVTGSQFLSAALLNIDCQSRAIGSYGFSALAAPDSPASIALTALITIFVALFGIRFLFGPAPGARDTVGEVIRVGLVLLLATSWPAWRVLGYDLVLNGPVEIARAVGTATGLPSGNGNLLTRLQNADDGIVVMTIYGSGRLTGGVSAGGDLGDLASGIALSDGLALGFGRTIFLSSTLGSFAVVRLGAGLLLALAPLMAGLALFSGSIGIFTGWLRGLVFCALGSVAIFVLQGAQLAMLLPWLNDVIAQREANTLSPSAPTELLVLTSAFALLTTGALFLIARMSFFQTMVVRTAADTPQRLAQGPVVDAPRPQQPSVDISTSQTRAAAMSESIATSMRREEQRGNADRAIVLSAAAMRQETTVQASESGSGLRRVALLGDEFRRSRRRVSSATNKRDRTL